MQSWFRYILPFGLVRALQTLSALSALGVSKRRAFALAGKASTAAKFQLQNFDLLPGNALENIGCALDVGANKGEWTAALLEFAPLAQVLCLEPTPALAARLRERFSGFPQVTVCEAALGASEGMAELKIMENPVLNSLRQPAGGMARAFPDEFRIKEGIRVKMHTLDSLTAHLPRIRILKIDTQGFEREVIQGAGETLRKTDFVLLEVNFQPHYLGEASFVELDARMQEHGFCIGNYSKPKGGKRQALFADVLYVRKES